MKKIFLFLFVQFSINIFAQETGIKFIEDQSIAQLLQKADSGKKFLFIDCYATWCGPCKYLSREIFPLKAVGDFYNANFVCAKFDMEKGEGVDIARKYQIKAYPTLLFLDANGEIVHLNVGAGDANDILNLGKLANDPENNYKALVAKINAGAFSAEIIDKYLSVNSNAGNKDSLLVQYFSTLKDPDKVNLMSWNLINKYVERYDDSLFKLLLANEDKFKKIAGPKDVDNKIFQVIITYIDANSKDEKRNTEVEKELKALNHPQVSRAYVYVKFNKIYSQVAHGDITPENWKSFICGAKEFLNIETDWHAYNTIAWFVYENYKKMDDTDALRLAKEWAIKSVQQNKNAYNLDTYANIVYDLNEVSEAIKLEEEALAIANKDNDQEIAKSLQERLDIFKGNTKK
jgi:thiol-disulfide isomerase/thioredoxin